MQEFHHKDGKFHRVGGPAWVLNGIHKYYFEGELHNPDGPAVLFPDGREFYFLHGKQLTEKEFNG